MTRYVVALGLATIALFGFNAWSLWFLDRDPDARDFFASSEFTLAVLMGGAFALFVCWIIVAALVFESDSPSGRSEPEDHV
ncbi:hypothetical protein [Sphingobium sp.]|uniref:hypothetical protein n=1 Tax=Sphingobium sp. TaxID=1912891 RepID=UPI002BC22C53|nr:hypothetical protein [Sphingobium sp.]HUD92306.1 hypothetical protein [Sphingobium sp.]